MEVTHRAHEGSAHTFEVATPREQVDAHVERRLEDLRRTARIAGFRRGRVPLALLRNHFGTKVRRAVLGESGIELARTVIAQEGLRPVCRPAIEAIEPTETHYRFRLLLETFPQIELRPFTGLTVQKLVPTPGERDIDSDRIRDLSHAHMRRQILDWLAIQHPFAVPRSMSEREYRSIVAAHAALLDEPLTPALKNEYGRLAERRVRLALLLCEIGRRNHILIAPEEIERLLRAQAPDDVPQSSLVAWYQDHPSAIGELRSAAFEAEVLRFVLNQATVEGRSVQADEFLLLVDPDTAPDG